MDDRRNETGRPLAGSAWLEAHHRAKAEERRAFACRVAALRPSKLVDLGCATGLWLQTLNDVLPDDCEFVGLDSDPVALKEAASRASGWRRKTGFGTIDLTDDRHQLPPADVTLMFNLSSYIPDLCGLLARIAMSSRHLVIRQYDGEALRFGPMHVDDRALIEDSLRAAVGPSAQFRHYDLDRLYEAIYAAPYRERDVSFELFSRTSPFPDTFADYYCGTLDWTLEHVSDAAAERLLCWRTSHDRDEAFPTYFTEVDLVAVLS